MDAADQAKLQIEAWKTTIQVQQHFNEIEMKIRALAITVLTAVLGAAAVAIKDGTTLHVIGLSVPLGSALLFVGLATWVLFYGVDQIWYHRLLIGAVRHGEALEEILEAQAPGFRLTKAISDASPYQFEIPIVRKKIGSPVHSTSKLRGFYGGVGLLLLIAALASAFGTDGAN
jgi:hypothetical protein